MSYPGLRQALREDPEGVKAVLSLVRRLPLSPGRASQSPPIWLELAKAIETESAWIPGAVNPRSGASGLIQFMPATARGLGTTVEEIRTMSRADQARLIETYLTRVARQYGGFKRPGEVYLALAYPAALAWNADRIVAEPGSSIWKQNEIWRDPAYDGAVTVRRLLEIGQPREVPADLRDQAIELVPDLEETYSITGKDLEPAPSAAPSSPAPSAAPSTPAPTPEPPDKGKPEATVAIPSAPVSTPPPSGRSSKGNGGATLGAALLGLGLLAWLLRRGCL